MRTITTTLYHVDELPTETAKERARDWWRSLEYQDPAWLHEHTLSRRAALEAVAALRNAEPEALKADVAACLEESHACRWTGYYADGIVWDNLKAWETGDDIPSDSQVRDWYDRAWEDDLESRMEDESVDESLRANEYEFTASGLPGMVVRHWTT